jgi:hypothetical protein
MKLFDIWLKKNGHIAEGESIFKIKTPESTPLLIVAWIMTQCVLHRSSSPKSISGTNIRCDIINPDGSEKDLKEIPRTYSHAMKLRSSLTYGFGRKYDRGTREWSFNKETTEWEGNPSISIQVARYMVALRRRKVVKSLFLITWCANQSPSTLLVITLQ